MLSSMLHLKIGSAIYLEIKVSMLFSELMYPLSYLCGRLDRKNILITQAIKKNTDKYFLVVAERSIQKQVFIFAAK